MLLRNSEGENVLFSSLLRLLSARSGFVLLFYTNNAKPGKGEAFLSSEDSCGDGRLKREFLLASLFDARSSVST